MSDDTDERTAPLPDAGSEGRDDAAGTAGDADTGATESGTGAAVAKTRSTGGWHAVSAWFGDRSAGRTRARMRRWLVGILVILAVIGVLVSSVTLWAHGVLFNTDKWVATVAPIAKDPEVTHNLSVYLAQRGVEAINIEQRTEKALPSQLDPLAAPIATAVQGYLQTFLQKNIEKYLSTPQAYDLWVGINRATHEQIVNALQNKPGALSINNGEARLNLLPLLSKALIGVQQQAPRLLSGFTIPEISPATPPAQANEQLSQALGVQLPSDFGQVTLLKSQDLSTAQKYMNILNTLVVVLVILTIALIVAAVWLSLYRRRTLIELGVGVALALIIARVVVKRIEENVVSGLAASGGPDLGGPILRTVIDNLQSFTLAFLIAGIIVAIGAFLVGKPHWFTRAGQGVAAREETGAKAVGGRENALVRFMARYADWMSIAGVVVALLILLLATPSWGWIIAILLILVGWEVLIRYLVYRVPPAEVAGGPSSTQT